MGYANLEAMRLSHESIGTEHILLGLLKEGSGVASNVLRNLGVDLKKVRLEVEKKVPPGHEVVSAGKLPFRPAAKKVIEYAFDESRQLGHQYVGTEHLILGLLRESQDVAAQILTEQGLKLEDVRQEVLRLLGHEPSPEVAEVDQSEREGLTKKPGVENVPAWWELMYGRVKEKGPGAPQLTLRACRVMELAFEEARLLGHNYVDTDHLLLALLREGDVVAARMLTEQGVDIGKLRNQVRQSLGPKPDGGTDV